MCAWFLFQSVLIDDESAQKLQAVIALRNVVVNIPFMLIGLGILIGLVFMCVICRQKGIEVRPGGRRWNSYLCTCFRCRFSGCWKADTFLTGQSKLPLVQLW